ncbi:diacylglycerol kinase catalytic region [Flammeovirgaceae bacterium 311]|nr:diacylglycerol kinase catalytic region [Flammeovirgaceae bacterium 311]
MAIRVTLLHNPQSGFNPVDKEDLLQALRKKGYQLTYVDTKSDDIDQFLQVPADLVVVAGGDGTVRKAGQRLLNKGVPIAVLPLGTANNIATSMGIKGKPAEIIAALDLNRKKSFDVGLLEYDDIKIPFLESAGFGLLPRLIREHSKDDTDTTNREEELGLARKRFIEMIRKQNGTTCSLQLDNQQLSGKFLTVQFMNICLSGPNILLAPQADPGDGLLQVVLVREEEREEFVKFVEDGPAAKHQAGMPLNLTAKKITVEWEGWRYHADDDTYEAGPPVKATIRILPGALEVLV